MNTSTYVIARTRKGRPTLMHKRAAKTFGMTACGIEMTGWSRIYMATPILGFFCKKCEKLP